MIIPHRVKDISGLAYGKLTVVRYHGKDNGGKTSWECLCECGETIIVRSNSLQSGNTRSCGCYHREIVINRFEDSRLNMVGKQFGRLVVESVAEVKNGSTRYNCKCNCGSTVTLSSGVLSSGHTKSCGCLEVESRITHGLSDHPLYKVYSNMKSRCYRTNGLSFHRYGGRGIVVCDEWLNDFNAFYNWAINNGYEPGLTIERSNNDDGYNPNNCIWAGRKDQARNRHTTKISVDIASNIRSDTRPNPEIAREYGLDSSTISRIKTGDSWR